MTALLIDGKNLASRAYYGARGDAAAARRMLGLWLASARRSWTGPRAVAFDGSRSFRYALYPAYKAGRSTKAPEMHAFLEAAAMVAAEHGYATVACATYEADDLLATMAARVCGPVAIVSGDRDLLQLVGDRVRVIEPVRGMSELMTYAPNDVRAKLGVWPSQVADYKALRGDPSDGIPGLPGCGPKVAARLLAQHGTLLGVIEVGGREATRLGGHIAHHAAALQLYRSLTRLRADAPIGWRP
jgi:DNA polymerase-1